MQKSKQWLSILLALQVLLALGLFIDGLASGSANTSTALLSTATSDIDRIAIDDGSKSVLLVKQNNKWTLADPALPASSSKIDDLLSTLAGLRTSWPLADTQSGRERYEVTESKFQRHLELYQGQNKVGDLYFGTSPGFRQTHARRAGEDEVYSLSFNNFDLPTNSNDWLDKALLAVDKPVSIEGADYVLQQQGDMWELSPDTTDQPAMTDQEKAGALASAFTRLRVLGIAQPDAMTAADTDEVNELKVGSSTGEWTYSLRKHDNSYLVSRPDYPQTFTLSSVDYERIAGIRHKDLLSTPAEAEDTAAQPETSNADSPAADTGKSVQ